MSRVKGEGAVETDLDGPVAVEIHFLEAVFKAAGFQSKVQKCIKFWPEF